MMQHRIIATSHKLFDHCVRPSCDIAADEPEDAIATTHREELRMRDCTRLVALILTPV